MQKDDVAALLKACLLNDILL